jgi:hypothetical protein
MSRWDSRIKPASARRAGLFPVAGRGVVVLSCGSQPSPQSHKSRMPRVSVTARGVTDSAGIDASRPGSAPSRKGTVTRTALPGDPEATARVEIPPLVRNENDLEFGAHDRPELRADPRISHHCPWKSLGRSPTGPGTRAILMGCHFPATAKQPGQAFCCQSAQRAGDGHARPPAISSEPGDAGHRLTRLEGACIDLGARVSLEPLVFSRVSAAGLGVIHGYLPVGVPVVLALRHSSTVVNPQEFRTWRRQAARRAGRAVPPDRDSAAGRRRAAGYRGCPSSTRRRGPQQEGGRSAAR